MNYPKPYDVLIRISRDDDTEVVFSGTSDECHIFIQGYLHGLISETAYYIHPDSEGTVMTLYSPLVSDPLIEVWIDESKPSA
jgi:hypothetical protein